MRKPAFCICEIKDTDQLRGKGETDQRLCFRYTDSTIPLLPKSEISSLLPSSVAVQPGLCGTWSETPKTGFLASRLIFDQASINKHKSMTEKKIEQKFRILSYNNKKWQMKKLILRLTIIEL